MKRMLLHSSIYLEKKIESGYFIKEKDSKINVIT